MAEATVVTPDKPSRRRLLGLVSAGGLFVAAGAAGFFAVRLLAPGAGVPAAGAGGDSAAVAGTFVPMEALTINLGRDAGGRILRFRGELEVEPALAGEVTALLPRIVDVLNGYLRAVEVADLEDRSALLRLRAQMLRRVQMVAGPGRVRDLLVMEFVVN